MSDVTLLALCFGGLLLVAGIAGAGAGLATLWSRAQAQPLRMTPAEKLREQAEAAIAQERLDEVAEVIERRRKRVEAANQRAAQREAAAAPQQPESGAQVATLSIPEQLAWAQQRARHRPFGGGMQ